MTTTETNLDVARELGRAAWRRNEDPFAIKDRALRPLTEAVPLPDTDKVRDALYRAWVDGWSAAQDAGEPRTDPPLPKPRPRLTITHTSADGTLLEGTARGDGAWEAIKAAQGRYRIRGWKYFPSIRAIGVSHSRDRAPQLGLMDATAEVLREAGFDVDVVVDGTPRAMEESEADRADRMDDRAEALHAKAERRSAEADSRYAAAQAIGEHIPAGQPVLVGHHSERGHRRDLKRMDGHMRKSVEAAEEAESAAERAATAERHMEARNNPRRVYRRIRTLEADLRKVERELAPCPLSGKKMKAEAQGRTLNCRCYRFEFTVGEDLLIPAHGAATGLCAEELRGRAAHYTEQIRYWREALEAAKAAGADVPPDTDAIEKGWWVRSWAGWCEVKRVNKVSVTVLRSSSNYADKGQRFFDQKIGLDDIFEIRKTDPHAPLPAVDLDAALAELDAADAARAAEPAPEPGPAPEPAVPARHPSGLSAAAVEVLTAAGATEQTVHLAGVPNSREVFAEVDQWLQRRAGFMHYSAGERAYQYSRDPRPSLAEVTGHEPVRPASGEHDKRLAYFATPAHLAAEMAGGLVLRPGARVLEPSAGDGALVAAVRAAHPSARVVAVEADRARTRLLVRRFAEEPQAAGSWAARTETRVKVVAPLTGTRFQDYAADRLEDQGSRPEEDRRPFDAVVMNPPFTEVGDPLAWATHFLLAWDLLADDGRMVAVLPASYRYSERQAARKVRGLVEAAGGAAEDLPEGAFKGSGTGVRTVLVTATKGTTR